MTAFRIAPKPVSTNRSPRQRAPGRLDLVRRLPCLACGMPPPAGGLNEALHVRFADRAWFKRETGRGEKPSDVWTVPGCFTCHREQHAMNEREFWERRGIDVLWVCALLTMHGGDFDRMRAVVLSKGGNR